MPSRRFAVSWITASSSMRRVNRSKSRKKKQRVIQVKEIKFRPGTDEGDYQVKLRNLIRFLEDGDKAKITLRFRGREMAHQQIGIDMLNRIKTIWMICQSSNLSKQDRRPSDDHGACTEKK